MLWPGGAIAKLSGRKRKENMEPWDYAQLLRTKLQLAPRSRNSFFRLTDQYKKRRVFGSSARGAGRALSKSFDVDSARNRRDDWLRARNKSLTRTDQFRTQVATSKRAIMNMRIYKFWKLKSMHKNPLLWDNSNIGFPKYRSEEGKKKMWVKDRPVLQHHIRAPDLKYHIGSKIAGFWPTVDAKYYVRPIKSETKVRTQPSAGRNRANAYNW